MPQPSTVSGGRRSRLPLTVTLTVIAVHCVACDPRSDTQSSATGDSNTSAHAGSTSGSPSTATATATVTVTATSGIVLSTSSAMASSSASITAGSTGSTSGNGGASNATSVTGVATTGDSGGAAGAPSTGTSGGGSDAGVFAIQDVCDHTACGGPLPDSDWRHVRACVETEALIGPLQSFCSSITLVGSSGELTGTMAFTGGAFAQDVSFSLTIELDVPAECNITCTSFASVLGLMGFPETACTESNGNCHCAGTARGTDPRSGEYTADATTLTLSLPYGDIATSYCAGENSFSYVLPVMLVPQGTPMDVVYETARR